MASSDVAGSSDDTQQINFLVKASNDTKYPMSLAGTATVADLKQKLSGSEFADAPADRLRLIFSGRVLKDSDTIAGAKIKEGHTIHMVKSAASNARQTPVAASSTGASASPAANVPTNIAAGTGNNPLAALTGARYAGFHGLPSASTFGADGGMSAGMNPEELERMLENPNFLQQMNEMMDNPTFHQMLLDHPMFRDNPMARNLIRDPNYRRIIMNPQFMLSQMRAQQQAERASARSSFPAPGTTDNTADAAAQGGTDQPSGTTNPPANPFGATPFGQLPAGNPFAALSGQLGSNTTSPSGGAGGANPSLDSLLSGMSPDFLRSMGQAGAGAQAEAGGAQGAAGHDADFLAATMRLMQNPDFQTLASSLQGRAGQGGMPAFPGMPDFGAMGAGAGAGGDASNPLAALYGMQPPRAESPADNRPPEERYADQLRQLNDMGFFDFDRNVQALRRSGGSVQGAVEHLLSGP